MAQRKQRRIPVSDEARENQLVSLAIDVAQEMLENRTASPQVIIHYLRLGTVKEKLQNEKLLAEIEKLNATIKDLEEQTSYNQVVEEALAAMRAYTGMDTQEEADAREQELY